MSKVMVKGKRISQELLDIIIKRIESMPPTIKIAVLGSVLTKEDILREIRENSSIGQELLSMEIDYYNDLLRD